MAKIGPKIVAENSHSDTGPVSNGKGQDKHYEQYLREREAMQKQDNQRSGQGNGEGNDFGRVIDSDHEDQQRADAVEELLKSLGRSRNS